MDSFKRKLGMFKVIGIAVILLLLCLIALHLFAVYRGLSSMKKLRTQTIEYVEEKIETYDNYRANDKTKSLVHLLDKTLAIVHNLEHDEFFYAKNRTNLLVLFLLNYKFINKKEQFKTTLSPY